MTGMQPAFSSPEGQPFVAVLIVTYNGRDFMKALLDSVLDQDYPRDKYQVVIADNGSTDGTADYVEQNYPSVRLFRLDRNYGPNRAQLLVVPKLQSQYIAYLVQDAVVHRRWLSELVEVMTSNPDVGIVQSSMMLPCWPEYEGLRREGLVERAYLPDLSPYGTHEFRPIPVTATTPPIPLLGFTGAGALSNLEVLLKLHHVLDPDFFAYFDDTDLGLRLNIAGYRLLFAPRSVLYHHTDWLFHWDLRSIRKALWNSENMILAFYKVCYWDEFLYLLPRLLLGKMIKAGLNQKSAPAKLLYGLLASPIVLVGLATALLRLPRFAERRRGTLAQRKMPHGWIVDRLLHSEARPDDKVWVNHASATETSYYADYPSLERPEGRREGEQAV